MFNVKLFPNFSEIAETNNNDAAWLAELKGTKEATEANYVGFAVIDYNWPDSKMQHYLTFPLEWIYHYLRMGYSDIDPFPKIDFRRKIIMDWDELSTSSHGKKILDEMSRYEIGNHHVSLVSLRDNNSCCVLTLSYQFQEMVWDVFRRDNSDIHRFYAERLNLRHEEIYQRADADEILLSTRERECLYWIAQGKTDEEIASKLGIGKWTVVSHIKSAKEKLGVRNRAAAVAEALTRDIIRMHRG